MNTPKCLGFVVFSRLTFEEFQIIPPRSTKSPLSCNIVMKIYTALFEVHDRSFVNTQPAQKCKLFYSNSYAIRLILNVAL